MGALRRAAADLVLGAACTGCGEPGELLCPRCRRSMAPRPRLCMPDPPPRALVEPRPLPVVAAGAYEGALRHAVAELKDGGRHRLLQPLTGLLLASITALGTDGTPLLLVPMPSRRSAVRRRGYDAIDLLATSTARAMRRRGEDVWVVRSLRHRASVRDQAGLDALERAENLAGALRCRPMSTRGRAVVLVDDVITTGASMAEAVRALRCVGAGPDAIAVVAATARRWPQAPARSGS